MILPDDFVQQMREILEPSQWDDFATSLSQNPPCSVRWGGKLPQKESFEGFKVPWCDRGIYLQERPVFTLDAMFHAGVYYPQEASSMFLYQVKRFIDDVPIKALDLCAAPGGKTTLLLDVLPKGSLLVSNEVMPERAHILCENVLKNGSSGNVVCNNTPAEFSRLGEEFDLVLVDAPCSGEGMFRKDLKALEMWKRENVKLCANRQKDILSKAWKTLKQGGILVYSTCTFNKEENEENVKWLLEEFSGEILRVEINKSCGVLETDLGYRFFPHLIRGEGFFITFIRKTSADKPFKMKVERSKKLTNEYFSLLKSPEKYQCLEFNGNVFAIEERHSEFVSYLLKNMRVLTAGVPLSFSKGKDIIPLAGLALSKEIDLEKVVTKEISHLEAISYLRRETPIFGEMPKGFVCITFRGVGLGWVKSLGVRYNNMYPNPWRIRLQGREEEVKEIF